MPSLSRVVVAAGLSVLFCALGTLLGPPTARAAEGRVALGVNTADAPGRGGAAIDEFEARVGRRPALVMWFQDWSEPLFYSSQMPAVDGRGAVPMVTWEPTGVPLREIASGARDDYIRQAARDARGWGKEFFVRFAHEMNGDWYSWGQGQNANTAADYIAAWRHVVGVFRAEGATNVRWVWAPNTVGYGVRSFEGLYPGDAWVDWVGLDGYNWGSHKASGWRSFSQVFSSSYDALTALTSKPVMVAETAAPEQGGDKADWITSALTVDVPQRMPRVRAFVWFDRLKEADWRVDSSASSLAAFRAAVARPLMGLDRAGLLGVGPGADPEPVPIAPVPIAPVFTEPVPGEPAPSTGPGAPAGPPPLLGGEPTSPLALPQPPVVSDPVALPRAALTSPTTSWVRGGVRVRLRVRGAACSRCSVSVRLRRPGSIRSVRMRMTGRQASVVLRRLSRGPVHFQGMLRGPAGNLIARSSRRRLMIR